MLISFLVFAFLLLIGEPSQASKIYIYEDPQTGERYYSNIPLDGNFKIYMKLPYKNKKDINSQLAFLKKNFNKSSLQLKFNEIFEEVSKKFNLDPHLLRAIAKVESNFNPLAISPKGAMGIMQLIPSTARLVGVSNPFDPIENIYGGARYLRMLLDEFGDLKLSLAAYNAGPEAVKNYGGIPPYSETINYVKNVLQYYEVYKRAGL
ncbi:MAG: lytic transglycosylase domain-containing protein [Caldimicrobium sp.]|nr:lytic transglycosylase domain-containing protein [Caldimicrobium sp.]MCX7873821.1 lytic transglycosylase domain-containing protein [Caldimicrobium sp.]MDW8094309.1 lytic transglycosylase domain-containing protein [Caldimicrobium sp.]